MHAERTSSVAMTIPRKRIGKSGLWHRVGVLLVSMGAASGSVVGIAHTRAQPQTDSEAAFVAANHAAMSTMMARMSVKPSGDVDSDFTAMMIPHHQGAIDMAQSELRYGTNEQLRRIAQEIIIDQQQEIVAMRLALTPALPPADTTER